MKKRTIFLHEKEYVAYFSRLIDLERKEEMDLHKKEISTLTAEQREKRGRCINNLKIYKTEMNSLGKFLVYLRRNKEIDNTEIKEGDVVLLSYGNPLKNGIQANVDFIGKNTVVLLFEKVPSKLKITKKTTYRIDLYLNETTYSRMKEALYLIKNKKSLFPIDILLGHKKPSYYSFKQNIAFYNKNLNPSQKRSVIRAINSEELYLIHGPPGTGKTTTLVEIALQLAIQGNKILITADSNTAVDNFLEKFMPYGDKYGISYVRIGSISRINKRIIESSLDYKVSKLFYNEEINKLYQEIEKKEMELYKYKKPTPSRRRGLSYDDILKLSSLGRSFRGIPLKKIKSMAKYIKIKREIDTLKSKVNKIREKIIKEIIDNSTVIFTTNSTAGSEILKDYYFDVVIIDEATQSTEPASLIPLIKSRKAILAGDHKQLPPTILNEKAKKEGLEISLFERLINLYPHISSILNIQYRMNEKIMNFSNTFFYSHNLKAHESVKAHELSKEIPPYLSKVPITFINTQSYEKRKGSSKSLLNEGEVEIVKEIINSLISHYKQQDIGIITPYKDQVEIIRKSLKEYPEIEVKTIDGFQGREKEIIIISLVRGNKNNNIGFLKDYRRLNVALTRAKKKVIIIGNEKTLVKDNLYKSLIKYIKNEGEYISHSEIKEITSIQKHARVA